MMNELVRKSNELASLPFIQKIENRFDSFITRM